MAEQKAVTPERVEIPLDDDDWRFTQSFEVGEADSSAAQQFFEKYGFVVFRDVLSAEEAEATRDEMWGVLEGRNDGFDRLDVNTWNRWSGKTFGMPGREPEFTPQIVENRQNPNVYEAFKTVIQEDDLLVSHDRWCVYRPTKDVAFVDGVRDAVEWRTTGNIHLDMNPWHYLNDSECLKKLAESNPYSNAKCFVQENNRVVPSFGRHVQAVLNLHDNVEEDGGFQIVPCFHTVFDAWARALGPMPRDKASHGGFPIASHSELQHFSARVTMRQGSMVLWDQRCVHGSRPNRGSRVRMAQFLKMFPARALGKGRYTRRAAAVRRHLRTAGMLERVTDVGQIVFGLQPYSSIQQQGVVASSKQRKKAGRGK